MTFEIGDGEEVVSPGPEHLEVGLPPCGVDGCDVIPAQPRGGFEGGQVRGAVDTPELKIPKCVGAGDVYAEFLAVAGLGVRLLDRNGGHQQ